MIPTDQTLFAAPVYDGKTYGNCTAACIASILEVPIASIPHTPYMSERFIWLEERGWKMIECESFKGYGIFTGVSPRTQIAADGETSFNLNHAVVALNNEFVFDPHHSRAGLLSVEKRYSMEQFKEIITHVARRNDHWDKLCKCSMCGIIGLCEFASDFNILNKDQHQHPMPLTCKYCVLG